MLKQLMRELRGFAMRPSKHAPEVPTPLRPAAAAQAALHAHLLPRSLPPGAPPPGSLSARALPPRAWRARAPLPRLLLALAQLPAGIQGNPFIESKLEKCGPALSAGIHEIEYIVMKRRGTCGPAARLR